jgi:ABC-type branched-subunit amino acid transport system substrate-binding protein/DNA-binding beta-propeller fold protein YncE/predicted Ser/Thr protein kinase
VRLELTTGSTFANYRIEGLVGRGGMGVVYRATDLRLERPVALKLIAPELAEDERFRERFLRESRLAASLDHRGVVPIHEAGEEAGQLFIAMRYVEGEDLKTLLQREGTLAPERALAILSQVAEALDAAHERGLVHRDVKPGNVLLDGREHAYLTDFGLTKQLGGASTETGQLVGTFDYLAPEQIRGEAVDARTDCYALACVLYECLAGSPPFRRPTEAEVLWAHMQEQPPAVRASPELVAVVQKALAKEKNERYGSCGDFLAAAASALGLEAPARRARRRRVGRRLIVAGAALIAAAAAAVAGIVLAGDGSELVAPGNAVAAVDPSGERVLAYTEVGTTPSNLVFGEGAVWVLNADDQTISKIDPQTRSIVKTFGTGGIPTDLAVGEGSVWVGNAGVPRVGLGFGHFPMASVARIDPDAGAVLERVELPGSESTRSSDYRRSGTGQLAIGAGGVWAINPDLSVSRLDPRTGRLVKRIDAEATSAIAAGREGVWFVGEEPVSVRRINKRTNRVGREISIHADFLSAIAVGAGSVWAAAPSEGLVWRIEPSQPPVTRTIDVGFGATSLALGDGALWVGNDLNGTVSRIDPRTNTVTAKLTLAGTPVALAPGGGSAWVSVSGGTSGGVLPRSACGEVESGRVREPDVLIASDFPLQGPVGEITRPLVEAIRFVLRERGFRAGEYTVGYQSCDDSSAQSGTSEYFKCRSNAQAYAQAERLVAVIGTFFSGCSEVTIPILNRAEGGALAQVSSLNTWTGLTRSSPGTEKGEPEKYYPTGVRNFFRVIPTDHSQGVAAALLARRLGVRRVYVIDEGFGVTGAFAPTARKIGLEVAGSETFEPRAESYDGVADRVVRSGARGILISAPTSEGAGRLIRALRARLGARAVIIGTDTFLNVAEVLEATGPAAVGMYVTNTSIPVERLPGGERRLVRRFNATQPATGAETLWQPETMRAVQVVLEAIARSDGTRASVLEQLRATRAEGGVFGSFRFDRFGDITPSAVAIHRVTGETKPGSTTTPSLHGAALDRVIRIPEQLSP